jgi:hypothetical protein
VSQILERLLTILKAEAELIENMGGSVPFRYKSNQKLILDAGRPFLKVIKPSPFKGEPKQCFQNCYQALWERPELNYCEGFAIQDDIPIILSHAWLVNDNMEVIDPTWVEEMSVEVAYFGVVFTKKFVMETAAKTKCYGILDTDYSNRHQLKREGFPQGALHPKFHSS